MKKFCMCWAVLVVSVLAQGKELSQPVIDWPQIEADLQIHGEEYLQEFTIGISQEVDMKSIQDAFMAESLLKDLNRFVKDAKIFSFDPNDGTFGMSLKIGDRGVYFDHEYNCSDTETGRDWSRHCQQEEAKGKPLFRGSVMDVICEKGLGSKNRGMECTYRSSGKAQDIRVAVVKKISAEELSAKLFVEQAAYLSQLSLILSGLASNSQVAVELFPQTPFKDLVSRIRHSVDVGLSARGKTAQISVREQSNGELFAGAR